MSLKLFLSQIADRFTRENFEKVERYVQDEPILRGRFTFFEFTLAAAVTNFSIKHGLNFKPIDVITTYKTNGVTVTWLQDSFTPTELRVTTSAACTIRAFIGRYGET